MEKLDPKTDGASIDIVAKNIEKLKEIFPDVFTEGMLDFSALHETLGNYIDDSPERYNFSWSGKSRARLIAQTPSSGTLRPCPEESVSWNTTQNIFIEGDNLEVLKLLQKSYHKKVKMIYIDPPYNTGNEFIYPDRFQDNLDTYLRYTGQIDDEGFKLSPNTETSGRYHTNWLNMMYPRLKLARNLLRDDGAIFISIDDIEVSNLRKICDEIFGEENLMAIFPWRKRTAKSDVPFGISQDFEWCIAYAKSGFLAGQVINRKYYYSDDYDSGWRLSDITTQRTAEERPNSAFTMVNPKNGDKYPVNPNRVWGVTKDTFDDYFNRGKIVFPGDYKFLNITKPAYRVFEAEDKEKNKKKFGKETSLMPVSTLLPEDVGRTENGTKEIDSLFHRKVFPFPKPSTLIKHFLSFDPSHSGLVLDFFAGSCPTAEAVLRLNIENKGQRKFIMVQLPEPCNEKSEAFNAGFKTIADIGKERIRRIINKLGKEHPEYQGDLGLKVFKLAASNIKPWDADFNNLELTLEDAVENIKPDRSEADVLYELLLKYGLDLTVPIEERQIAEKTVYIIGAGALVVCLAGQINLEVVEGIAALKEELKPEVMRVVFKDAGFKDDVVKTNTVQILRQAGIEDVKSL